MVLIIRNNRILSSRHPRIKRFLSYVQKNQHKSNRKKNLAEQDKEQTTVMTLVAVLGKLFLYSVAMFTLPFAAFFGAQHIMKTEFHVDRFMSNCISVFAAVVTVNLIISFYAYQALHEPDNASEMDTGVDTRSKESLNAKID